jgi:phenylalanyl-tRNA synthetase beta chain
MLISLDWLRAFVPNDRSTEELRHLITAHVATVDRVEQLRADLSGVVIARVIEAGRHPNSEKLWLTRVDDGSGQLLDVVCGAPLVEVGTLYPFARTGITLPGGVRIEKRKIRGVDSNGMLCSARELALGDDHQGIMALEVAAPPGTPFLDAVPVGDVRFDVDVLPNRPDLLSHLGMARELAALTGLGVADPAELGAPVTELPALKDLREAYSGGATIKLEDVEGCPRYMGVVVRGIRVGPSPDWLVKRLESMGLRSISNVVDVTNYLLHGYGQPMHAFDLARLAQQTVVIRRAIEGETLVTLDGVKRTLDPRMTVIADAERATAIAGVMGGHDSEVTHATSDVLLEVAYFKPRNVRATRRALGLSTDASYRYERGIDPEIAPHALAIAARLIASLGGGRIDGQPLDVGSVPPRPSAVSLRPERISLLLGDEVSAQETTRLLRAVRFGVETTADGARLLVSPPSWRNDVSRECDLAEEVARLRGYDVLPDTLRPFQPSAVPDDPRYITGRRVRDLLASRGLAEIVPLPFVKGDDATHQRVLNPLADDEPHLRTKLLATLARRAEHNLRQMQGNVRLFEIGSAFVPRASTLPKEELRVAALIMGARRPPHVTEPRPPAFDHWDLKALIEEVARSAFPGERVEIVPATEVSIPEALWVVRVGEPVRIAGAAGAVTLDRPVWAAPAYGFELTLADMPNEDLAAPGANVHDRTSAATRPAHAQYQPLPTTPAAEVDLALIVPDALGAATVELTIRQTAGELLERLELFDEFRGEGVPAGHRSLAWRLTFRDRARTLRDKEVEGRRQNILRSLEKQLGVRQRGA